jgi:acetyl-CoA synthetase
MATNIGDVCRVSADAGTKCDRTALRLVRPDLSVQAFSFGQIDSLANQFANVLDETGEGGGKTIAILLPKCAEVFYGFLGMLKARSLVLPLFANFGDLALVDRLADCAATCVLTKRSSVARLQGIRAQLPALRTILVTDSDQDLAPDVLSLPDRLARASSTYQSQPVQPETPSLLHYTSGSTGKPKGVLHTHGGLEYLQHSAKEILQLGPGDLYWCTADHGWITGTSYGIIAPWYLGATQVQFAGAYDPDSWFRVLETEQVTVWYTAPTALRMLMRADDIDYRSYDLGRLRSIFSVGEPLNPEISRWAAEVLKHEIYDTWFQTETGGIMIANRPGLPVRPGSMGKPVSTISAAILDTAGTICPPHTLGHLSLRYPWPSMFRDYLHRSDVYRARFSAQYYDSGDLAHQDEDGYFWFSARNDDVINTSGHLVSPFEVESALLELPEVAESGAVGVSDPVIFEKIVVFVALRLGVQADEDLQMKIRLHVANRLSAVATPRDVVFVDKIPKNKSGKILRRVLRARYLGEDPGDLSTIEDQP